MGVVIHDDMWKAIQALPERQRKGMAYALLEYGFDKVEPEKAPWLSTFLAMKERIKLSSERSKPGRKGRQKRYSAEFANTLLEGGSGNLPSYKEVEDEVKGNTPYISPQPTFTKQTLDLWNEITGQSVMDLTGETKMRLKRIEESGRTIEDVAKVIRKKNRQWMGDPKMGSFLRPEVVFKRFEEYLNEPEPESTYEDVPALRL